jgi:hypothetical protein
MMLVTQHSNVIREDPEVRIIIFCLFGLVHVPVGWPLKNDGVVCHRRRTF